MSRKKNIILLSLDDAAVTIGSQFREIALGLLITGMYSAPSGYAWYFLVMSIPGLLLARTYAWASHHFNAKKVMMASYGFRLLLVLGLWRVNHFWVALILLAGMAVGRGFYSVSQAQYVAVHNDFAATRNMVVRLRQSESVMLLIGPLLAGWILAWTGYRNGFLLSAGAYIFSLTALSQLDLVVRIESRNLSERILWRPDGPTLAILGLSFLTWQANTLSVSYIFLVLHRHALGFGMMLGVWGGSGLVAGLILSRIRKRPLGWIAPMFGVLSVSWLVLSRGVAFPGFVVLGGIEGFANWMVRDLIAAFVFAKAPPGHGGLAQARLGVYDEIGSIAGILMVLLIPAGWLILPMYAVIGFLGALMAGTMAIIRHRRQPHILE